VDFDSVAIKEILRMTKGCPYSLQESRYETWNHAAKITDEAWGRKQRVAFCGLRFSRPRLIAALTDIATTTQHWIAMLRLTNHQVHEESADTHCKARD
jgi:hypothetical protein